ncbi:MAG: hypothetical protein AAF383_18955 [Cyanobacteria bacterium P01_A01_bin.83]
MGCNCSVKIWENLGIWAVIDAIFIRKFFVPAQIPAQTRRSDAHTGWL